MKLFIADQKLISGTNGEIVEALKLVISKNRNPVTFITYQDHVETELL